MNRLVVTFLGTLLTFSTAIASQIKCDEDAASAAADSYLAHFYKHSQVFVSNEGNAVKSDNFKGYEFDYVEILPDEERNTSYASGGKVYVGINADGLCEEPFARGKSMHKAVKK